MELSPALLKALNDQVQAEMFSAYLYGSMSADFKDKNYDGFAAWMMVQAKEEMEHARKIYDYIFDRGGRVTYQALEAPQASWDSAEEAFEASLAHEQKITGMIHDLLRLARKEDDLPTESFLQWFVDEQVEEEDSVETVLAKIRMVGKTPNGLYLLDRELAARGQG